MKRFMTLGLVIVLVLSLSAGCAKKPTLADGNYTAESQPDDQGYKGVISITIQGGKITVVDYDEYNAEGVRKSEETEYADSMKEVSGITPAEAYEQLEQSLVTKNNPNDVDAVTGATTSSKLFVQLANEALNKQ